jgi:hypothetical protein
MAMNGTICEQLDGYLGKGLTEEQRAEFEAHLATCLDCRRVVQEQQQIERLLARATAGFVPVPAGLRERIEGRLRRAHRRRSFAWETGLAAAVVLVCALTVWFFTQQTPKEKVVRLPMAAVRPPPPEAKPDPRSLVQVTFPPPSDVIAVRQKTDNPSVTIIWVYPTIKAAQEPSSAPFDHSQPSERTGT